ncbi:hypothetical protein ES702_00366 [subsurface metagenome]
MVSWIVSYEATVLPQNAVPPWQAFPLGIYTATIVAGKLEVYVPAGAGNRMVWRLNDALLSNSVGVTYELRVKVLEATSEQGDHLKIEDGKREGNFHIRSDGVWMNGTRMYAMDTSAFHTYRLIQKGNKVKLYVDDVYKGTTTNTLPAAVKRLEFSIYRPSVNVRVQYDWVRYARGDFPPPGPLTVSSNVPASVRVVDTAGKTVAERTAPFIIDLDEGTYTLYATYDGETQPSQTITIIGGVAATATFTFTIEYALHIESNPSPINFTLNDSAVSTPFKQKMVTGTYVIVMPSSITVEEVDYTFLQWQDGSTNPRRTISLTHDINQPLTATYVPIPEGIEGAAPASQRQIKDALREVLARGGDISPTNPMQTEIVTPLPLPTEIVSPLPLPTEDTGVHSNPEKWLHDNHWEAEEVTITVAGAGGEQNLGAAVPAGETRRIRELTIRHAGTNNTVVTLLIAGGNTKVSIDITAQSTRVWSSQDGRQFIATEQSAIQSSDVTGGNTFVSAGGVEA